MRYDIPAGTYCEVVEGPLYQGPLTEDGERPIRFDYFVGVPIEARRYYQHVTARFQERRLAENFCNKVNRRRYIETDHWQEIEEPTLQEMFAIEAEIEAQERFDHTGRGGW